MAVDIRRTVPCDQCGQPASQTFGEGGRGWFEFFGCPSCGQEYAAHGMGPAPDEFRRVILAEEGEWALNATTRLSVGVLLAVRETLSLSLSQVQELKGRMPGELRRGTRHEMERLLRILEPSAEPGTLLVRRTARA
jgi:hypothetical protein